MDELVGPLMRLKGSASRNALRAVLTAAVAVGLVGCGDDTPHQPLANQTCDWTYRIDKAEPKWPKTFYTVSCKATP